MGTSQERRPRRILRATLLTVGLAGSASSFASKAWIMPSNSRIPRGGDPKLHDPSSKQADVVRPRPGFNSATAELRPFVGLQANLFRLVTFVAGSINVIAAVSRLAAPAADKKRRRKQAPSTAIVQTDDDGYDGPLIDGMRPNQLAAKLAKEFAVTDDDRKRRRESRRRKKNQERLEEVDPIRNLVEGDDPEFFGFPYIWVQIAHLVLGGTALLAAFLGGKDVEFALFDLQGGALETVKLGVQLVAGINMVNAVVLYREALESEGMGNALGWGLKAIFVGGVASWQRYGRIQKAITKARDAQIDRIVDLETGNWQKKAIE